MSEFCIRERCNINTNKDEDTFVGIKCEEGEFSIHFPLGFHLSEKDKDIRKDIILLMSIIKSTTEKKDSLIYRKFMKESYLSFPFQAYLEVIYDYYNRGYYKEKEIKYSEHGNGKISWNKTIKLLKPTIQDEQAFYLEFISRNSSLNNNEIITQIHEYCVYDSFLKIGWLFTDKVPPKPRLKFNYKLFKSIVIEKMTHTFNDRNKLLFKNMLLIIDNQGINNSQDDYKYGTYKFEYVWQEMIDKVFGIKDKKPYFPKTKWKLDRIYCNSCLEPDTIMLWDNDIFILDAKYYKYGQTKNPQDLPGSASIDKQITYGEYVSFKQKQEKKKNSIVYNAFVMPFDSFDETFNTKKSITNIGEAIGEWKDGTKEYEHIQGILIDVKYLMNFCIHNDRSLIYELSLLIKDNCKI